MRKLCCYLKRKISRANVLWLAALLIFIASCEAKKATSTSKISATSEVEEVVADTIRIENEALEYEIIILEVGFEAWLATQKPMDYYTQTTLENKNKFYVSEWNRRASLPSSFSPLLYNQQIWYQFNIDYGMEVNYMLFMYFQFFQKKYKQRL